MKIELFGKVISKKNSKKVGVNRYTQRIYVTSSNAWKIFEKDALWQLKKYRVQNHFDGKIKITYVLYFKENGWLDIDNAITSINDLLQQSTIIRNDRDIKEAHIYVVEGYREWKTEIIIAYVQATTKATEI